MLPPHLRNHQITPDHVAPRLEFHGSEARGPDDTFVIHLWIKNVSFNTDNGLCIQ